MKKKIGLLVLALGLTVAAVWSSPAEAFYPFCEVQCAGMPSNTNCTCQWLHNSTTCGQWHVACAGA